MPFIILSYCADFTVAQEFGGLEALLASPTSCPYQEPDPDIGMLEPAEFGQRIDDAAEVYVTMPSGKLLNSRNGLFIRQGPENHRDGSEQIALTPPSEPFRRSDVRSTQRAGGNGAR